MHTSHLSFHHETLHEELARIVSSQGTVPEVQDHMEFRTLSKGGGRGVVGDGRWR